MLQSLLLSKLQEVICLWGEVFKVTQVANPIFVGCNPQNVTLQASSIPLDFIPLQRVKDTTCILYSSAIALRLEKFCQLPAVEIATEIAEQWSQSVKANILESQKRPWIDILRDFTVKAIPPGWMKFELSDPDLAKWLQFLVHQLPNQQWNLAGSGIRLKSMPDLLERPISKRDDGAFTAQYAHARCLSLLHLADREELLTRDFSNRTLTVGEAIALEPIPWLNANQQLRLKHPSERQLLSQLLNILDEIYCPVSVVDGLNGGSETLTGTHLVSQAQVSKLAKALSQRFLTFYADCRIWGDVQRDDRDLAHARLGLVILTQSLLQLLLQEFLQVPAPLEL